MEKNTVNKYKTSDKNFKRFTIKTLLYILGKSCKTISSYDEEFKKQLATLDKNIKIQLFVEDKGPGIALIKKLNRLVYAGREVENPDLAIYFKNIDSAFMIISGQIGIEQAYAEHRIKLKGNIMKAVQFVRLLTIVETILFPRFIQKKFFKRLPKIGSKRMGLRILLYIKSIGWFFKSLFIKL